MWSMGLRGYPINTSCASLTFGFDWDLGSIFLSFSVATNSEDILRYPAYPASYSLEPKCALRSNQ